MIEFNDYKELTEEDMMIFADPIDNPVASEDVIVASEKLEVPVDPVGFVLADRLNLRKSPSTNGEIIKVLDSRTPLYESKFEKGKKGEWRKVSLEDGTEGFVMHKFVEWVKLYE